MIGRSIDAPAKLSFMMNQIDGETSWLCVDHLGQLTIELHNSEVAKVSIPLGMATKENTRLLRERLRTLESFF